MTHLPVEVEGNIQKKDFLIRLVFGVQDRVMQCPEESGISCSCY